MAIFIFLSRGIDLSSKKVGAGLYFMSFSVLFLFVLFLIGKQISRIDGVLLLGLFFINFFRMIKKKEKYSATHKDKFKRHEPILYSFLFILCLIVLFVSSNYVVKYAESISVELNIPELVVGIFLLSFATTLPELIFGINAVLLKHKEMSVGDQIGTVFTNLTLIVGIVAIIHPITTSLFPFLFSCFFLLLSCLIFVHFVNNNRNLSVTEGIHLFLLYFIFVLVQFIWLK
jgi:cation:H+ antiporter